MLRCHGWGCQPPLTESHIHIGCIKESVIAPWDAVDGHMCTPSLIAVIRVQVGVNFRENRVCPSLYDVVVSWLRLQTPIDCIPHSYWMYTKCYSTLWCCGWAYGYTLPYSHYTSAGGGDFRENGEWLSLYDVVVSWLRLPTPIDCIPHLYWMYTKCFSTLRCCGWAYGCILMLWYYMCRWGLI